MLPLKLPVLKIARHSTNSNEQTANIIEALASDRDAVCAYMNLSLNLHLFIQSLMAKLIQFSSSTTTAVAMGYAIQSAVYAILFIHIAEDDGSVACILCTSSRTTEKKLLCVFVHPHSLHIGNGIRIRILLAFQLLLIYCTWSGNYHSTKSI